MSSGWSVSSVGKVVGSFFSGWGVEDLADGPADGVGAALGGFSEHVLEFGKELLDGVEVWRLLQQINAANVTEITSFD
jgi:hypothetical protein